MDRSMNSQMLITQDTKRRIRNLEMGGDLESGDGGDDVIKVEELEKAGPVERW